MSVLVMDSFDWNGNTIISSRYEFADAIFSNAQTKHDSGYALYCDDASVRYDIAEQGSNTIIVGFYVYIVTGREAAVPIIRLMNSAWGLQISLDVTESPFHLEVAGVTGSQVLSPNTWYHIEWKIAVVNSTAADECVVKIDGIIDIDAIGIDTQAQSSSGLKKVSPSTIFSQIVYFDDFYVLDTSGSYANDFIGPLIRIDCLEPNGNGNSNDFVGSDADSIDNYLHVDESPADEGVSYVESSTLNHRDGYTFDNLAGNVDFIMAIQTMTRHTKGDSDTSRIAKHFIRRDGTDYDGPTEYTLQYGSYENGIELWEEDPSTSLQWLETDVNAIEAGIKVQA